MTRTADVAKKNGAKEPKPRITLLHATSPGCWWSWGYEATLNRVRLVYGDQVEVRLFTYDVYDNFDTYLSHSGMTFPQYQAWQKESAELMGVPVESYASRGVVPPATTPATLAALAAQRQGEAKARRFTRALTRLLVAEGRDAADPTVIRACAVEAGLDEARLKKDLADRDGLRKEMENQRTGHLPLGFYNLAVTDHEGRTVLLDHAFEPDGVERAIDFLSGGTLRKASPTDIEAYLRENGPAPPSEIARVFGLPREQATVSLKALQTRGRAREVRSPSGALCFAPA